MYVGHLEPERVESRSQESVKDFILKVSQNLDARWIAPYCIIWDYDKGLPVRVTSGSYYSNNEEEIYLRHTSDCEVPNWVPGALSAVAQLFGIGADPEISQALVTIATNIAIGIFRPIQHNVAQTFSGIPVVHLAVNSRDHLLAGQVPPDSNDPDSVPIWRLHLSGEPVEVDGPDWSRFSLQS